MRLGLEARAGEKLVALSHGNQQRVQLAVALVHGPGLLVLDEPFAGLDPEAVDSLSEIIRDQARDGAAILFSSHQLELIERVCNRIVILERGRGRRRRRPGSGAQLLIADQGRTGGGERPVVGAGPARHGRPHRHARDDREHRTFTVHALNPPPAQQAARDVAALAAGILLYVAMTMYGAAVANGVAQEKTSRAAEVLLAAVRPRQLLTGKVLGIGTCGVGQLAIPVIAALIANAIVHSARVPSSVWVLLPVTLLWFALGYAFYAFLFAAAGAMIARQEEVQFATAPLTFPLLLGYLLVYAVIASPTATWIRILSYVPPLAPTLMPPRVAVGDVAWWEVPLDVVIMLIAIYGVIRIAARIYEGALVRGGARLTWRAALRPGEASEHTA